MKADCCDSDAVYITASSYLLCEIGKRAFELGQRLGIVGCGATNFDGRRCAICQAEPDPDKPFYVLGPHALCEACYWPAERSNHQNHTERIYLLRQVYVCQMWPDGPWLLQGTVQGGLAEMVERMCVHHTAESVLHAFAEYMHIHATDPVYSFRTLYDSLWMRFMTVGVLKARPYPYQPVHYPMDLIELTDESAEETP